MSESDDDRPLYRRCVTARLEDRAVDELLGLCVGRLFAPTATARVDVGRDPH